MVLTCRRPEQQELSIGHCVFTIARPEPGHWGASPGGHEMPSHRQRFYCKNRYFGFVPSSVLLIVVTVSFARGQAETYKIDVLVKRWAPIIWLAPEEKFLPLSVEEFLEHVFPADHEGHPTRNEKESRSYLPDGKESRSLFLHTKRSIDSLKNESSFLYGKNPKLNPVPVYAIVSNCNNERNDLEDFNEIFMDSHPHFHVTYWIFFPYNEGKEICLFGNIPTPLIFNTCFGRKKIFGNHIGDFEHLSMSFKGKPYPDELYLSTHDAGVYYKYIPHRRVFKYIYQVTHKSLVQRPKFPQWVRTSKGRPVLFSALGSHGLWSSSGHHYFVRVPKLYDTTGYGVPWKTWYHIKSYHLGFSKPPMWIKYQGKWGNPKSRCVISKRLGICEFSDGPEGVLNRTQDFYCGAAR